MTTAAAPTSTRLGARQGSSKGHVGLVVLASIAAGLALGLLLVLVVLAGGPEHEILGASLLALGAGFVVLATGSSRFTDQPQAWALAPRWCDGRRRSRNLGARARRSHTHSRRMALACAARRPRRVVLPRRSPGAPPLVSPCLPLPVASHAAARSRQAAYSRPLSEATTDNPAPDRHVSRGRPQPLPPLRRNRRANGRALQRSRRENAQLGMGAAGSVFDDARLRVRPGSRGLERRRTRSPGRASARRRPPRSSSHGAHPRSLRAGRASVGGVYALVYADQYPREVAGVALIDSATPYQFDLPDYPGFFTMGRRLYSVMPVLAHAGIARLAAAGQFAGLPELHAGRHERSPRLRASYGPTMPTSRNCRPSSSRRKR